jgi:hypothetical protein
MRVVASHTAVFVDDAVEPAFHEVIVALGTKVRSCLEQEGAVFRGVGIVAIHAAAVHCRFMGDGFRSGVIMAFET